MRRREFIALMGASVAWPFAAMAQQAGRTYRLGLLLAEPRDDTTPTALAFIGVLRRGGFIEGQNLTVEYRAYGQHFDLLSQYATELVNARVDVIVAGGMEQFARFSRRRKPFRSLGSSPICSGPVS
jgi:putative tryptophan/tyrosine transport system substrate-binding protein